MTVHPNFKKGSNSSSVLQHKCPRKFELYKLGLLSDTSDDGDEHLEFGTVVGIGTQTYFATDSKDQAYMDMLMAQKKSIEDDTGERNKKTFWYALNAVDKFTTFRHTELSRYQVAEFGGKAATELGFVLHCPDGYEFRGFLDILLIDTYLGELIPYEGKTTKFKTVHEAVYKNSGQALGYSLITDAVAASLGLATKSSFDVIYSIFKSSSMEWEQQKFRKSHSQRAKWIKNLLVDNFHISNYAEADYFPMHGENCFDFFRPCGAFGVCELENKALLGGQEPRVIIDDPSKYQFHFSLEEIIKAQFEKFEEVL